MNYEVVNGSVVDEGYLMTGHLQVTAWRPEKEREREKKKKRERERLKQTLLFFSISQAIPHLPSLFPPPTLTPHLHLLLKWFSY